MRNGKNVQKILKWSSLKFIRQFEFSQSLKNIHAKCVLLSNNVFHTYSCFDKGCPTTAQNSTRQCRVLWRVNVSCYLIEVHGGQLEGKSVHLFQCLCCFLPKYLGFNQSSAKPSLLIITFDTVAFTLMPLQENLSQNS